jgi:hypothetical protein
LGKAASAATYGIAIFLVLTVRLCPLLGMSLKNPLASAVDLQLEAFTFSLLGIVISVMVKEVSMR